MTSSAAAVAVPSSAHVLRGLLSASEVDEIHVAGRTMQQQRGHPPQKWEKVYMHAGGAFAGACPDIWQRLLATLRGFQSDERQLGVRCCEYHTYRVGAGLTDPDHCDMGSVLTMSCLLSEPSQLEGGVFTTTENGQSVPHDSLARGDAIVIPSSVLHNVTTVTAGVRNSLVIGKIRWSRTHAHR